MDNKFTTPPWDVTPNHSAVYDNEGTIICVMHKEISSIEESKANAYLIAGAPELLEALKNALSAIETFKDEAQAISEGNEDAQQDVRICNLVITEASAAINKATGVTP